MVKSDNWRVLGFEDDLAVTQILAPTSVTGTTPAVGPSATTGIDLRTKGRKRFLIIAGGARTAAGMTITVTESATTNGTYAAATTSGDLTKMTASGVVAVSVKRNPAKPFLRVTATGDGGSADWIVGMWLVGL
jgi:hypothetical protein